MSDEVRDEHGNIIPLSPEATRVHGAGGDVTGAPIEGKTRENQGKALDTKNIPVDAHVGTMRPVNERESGPLAAANQASREAKESLTQTSGGALPDSVQGLKESIEKKLEDKSPEGVKADISGELGHPPVGGGDATLLNPSRTVQREDGTITTADRPDETAHYIAGNRVMITDAQKEQYDALNAEVNGLQDGRALGDIPVSDRYHEKKKELDAFVANLKR